MALASDAREWLQRMLVAAREAAVAVAEATRRAHDTSLLKLEIARRRRRLGETCRELGHRVHELARERGEVPVAEIAGILRRLDELEREITDRERRVALMDHPQGRPPGAPSPEGSSLPEPTPAVPAPAAPPASPRKAPGAASPPPAPAARPDETPPHAAGRPDDGRPTRRGGAAGPGGSDRPTRGTRR